MLCFISQLSVDVWSHVLSLLSLKHICRLDSAALGGAARIILHEDIFPRSSGQSLRVSDKGHSDKKQREILWCLNHGVPIRELCLHCVEYEELMFELLALHRHLVRHIILLCEEREDLLRTLKKLNRHALDDLVNQRVTCGPHFDLPEGESLTAEERRLCGRVTTIFFEGKGNVHRSGVIR